MNLNAAHIHLLVNHIPVFGTVFAALLIAWGLLRKSEEVLRLGLVVAVIVAAGTWLVQLTGEPAEHLISGMQDVQRRIIHEHEEAAELSTWVITAFGIASLLTLVMVHRRRASGRMLAIVSLLLGLAGSGLVARAASLGGEIRHPEVRAGFVPPPPPPRPAGAPRERD